jgi:hypothetical protein
MDVLRSKVGAIGKQERVSEHGLLPRAIWNTVVQMILKKAYALKCSCDYPSRYDHNISIHCVNH